MTAPDPGIPHNCNNCSQTVRHNAEIWQFWQFWSKLKSNCNLSRRWPPSVWRWWWRPPHYHTGNVSSAPVGRRQNWDKKYWWEVRYLSSHSQKDFQCFPLFQFKSLSLRPNYHFEALASSQPSWHLLPVHYTVTDEVSHEAANNGHEAPETAFWGRWGRHYCQSESLILSVWLTQRDREIRAENFIRVETPVLCSVSFYSFLSLRAPPLTKVTTPTNITVRHS